LIYAKHVVINQKSGQDSRGVWANLCNAVDM